MGLFDASKFTTVPHGPFDDLLQMAAVVNGVRPPIMAFRQKRVKNEICTTSVCKHNNIVVVLVQHGGELFVTTYWDANPDEVLETVQGTREFLKLSNEWTWSGGPATMTPAAAFTYMSKLVTGEST